MIAEKLSILALSENWHFLILEVPLDDPWLLILQDGKSVHIEVAALQTVDTLTDFLTGHVLAFSLILQELIEDGFEPLDQLDLLEVTLQLIHSHHWNWSDFLIALGSTASVFEISAVVHLVETGEKLSHLLADEEVTEDVDLEVGPNFVQSHHELMMIFTETTALRAEPLCDILVDEELDVFPHVFVDLYFFLDGGLALLCEIIDESV